MPPKRQRPTETVVEEANQHSNTRIKRRKNSLSADSTTTNKGQAERCKALKQLLVDGVEVTTNNPYENKREETRPTELVQSRRTLSVLDAIAMVFKGTVNSV